jgi:2-iminobutanoate/2-iminopropanoate deaminase
MVGRECIVGLVKEKIMVNYISDVPNAPKAIGPYSPATVANGFAFISGQIPLDPATGEMPSTIEAQTDQVMKNLRAILTHLKIDFTHVVKSTIFLTDLGNFGAVNSIYEKHLGNSRPARATVQVSALPKGANVEIEMIAAI